MTHSTRLQMSVMMFLQYFLWGAWFVTLGSYMTAVGYGDIMGRAFSKQGIAAIAAPLFVGMIADRFLSAQQVLGIGSLIGGELANVIFNAKTAEGATDWRTVWLIPAGLAAAVAVAFAILFTERERIKAKDAEQVAAS